jgi:hypothetical protein
VKNELIIRLLNYEQQHLAATSTAVVEAPASSKMDVEDVANMEIEQDENTAPAQANILSSPKPEGSRKEFGKQLLSPIRALAAEASTDTTTDKDMPWVKEHILTKDEELLAFRARFFPKF